MYYSQQNEYTIPKKWQEVWHFKESFYFFLTTAPSKPPYVAFGSRTKNSLSLSWRAPDKQFRNGKLTGYRVCHSDQERSNNPTCIERNTTLTYTINNLQSSTKYFVTVSAGTSVGFGANSAEISKITNGGK